MNTVWVAVLPLAAKGPNPADVKPGWLGFAVFLALAAALVLLMLSFVKQLKKVDFVEEPGPGEDGSQSTRRPTGRPTRPSGPARSTGSTGPTGRPTQS